MASQHPTTTTSSLHHRISAALTACTIVACAMGQTTETDIVAETDILYHTQMALASDTVVVVDLETGLPLRDVKLFTNTGTVCVSDYRGRIVLPDSSFQSATLTQPKYLSRVVERYEMTDTMEMLPQSSSLGDVVVWGVDRRGIKSMVGSATQGLSAYAPAPGAITFDFFELFRKKPLNRKARRKNKELLENWEQEYRSEGEP